MAHYNPKTEHSLYRRTSGREVKQTFLIICEGLNTEPDYFNAFRLTSAHVRAIGKGKNTLTLIREAIVIKEQERRRGRSYDQYWVVFDKDEFPDADFNGAISLAGQQGFHVAYSNQAFEFWFLLHFNLYQGPLSRFEYAKMLTRLLGAKYSKEAAFTSTLYNRLLPMQSEAITRAKSIMASFGENTSPAKAESSTTVYRLVEELNRFI